MAVEARTRWIVLLSALAGTLVATFYPVADSAVAVVSALPRAASMPNAGTVMPGVIGEPIADAPEGGGDPFAPRGWTAPVPPLPPAPAAAPVAVTAIDLTPPGPPELPFRYVGSLIDGNEQTVYLARGEQAYVARTGDVLDSHYKVLGIAATQVQFEHIPTGAKQALAFPARDN